MLLSPSDTYSHTLSVFLRFSPCRPRPPQVTPLCMLPTRATVGRAALPPPPPLFLFPVRAQRPSQTSGPERHCAGRQARSPPSFGSDLRDNSPGDARLKGARARRRRCGRPQRGAPGGSPLPGEALLEEVSAPPPPPPAPGRTRQTPTSSSRKKTREVWTSSSVQLAQEREPAAALRSSGSGRGRRREERGGTREFALARHVPCHLPSLSP